MLGTEDNQRKLADAEALCAHLVKEGTVYAFLAEHRLELFSDEKFLHLYPSKEGRPSIPASRIASIMVLQSLEGLSDREALEQVRLNIAWKIALGLPLDDEGFSPNVLTYWRNKIAQSDQPQLIFDLIRDVVQGTGILTNKKKRALDSTVLSDAVSTQDTFSQLVAQIKAVRRQIPTLQEVPLSDVMDYTSKARKPAINYRDDVAVEEALTALITGAVALIDAATKCASLTQRQVDALGLLGLLSFQDVECVDEHEGRFRLKRSVAKNRVVSTVDPDARHVHKSQKHYIDGFKGHIAVEPDTEIITEAILTKGNVTDTEAAQVLLGRESDPCVIFGDAGYSAGAFRSDLKAKGHDAVIKPHPLSVSISGGYSIDDFVVNESDHTVTCPANHTVTISSSKRASFMKYCGICPQRERCTRAKRGRVIVFSPHHQINQRARQDFSGDLKASYNTHRPTVERVHAQMKRKLSSAKVRYRGVRKNDMFYALLAATWNLKVLLRNSLVNNQGTWTLALS